MTKLSNKQVTDVVLLHALERSTLLLSIFRDGYTSGWSFRLPKAFQEALDIRLTTRMVDGKEIQCLTQGSSFNFKTGDIIYDSSLAYTLAWEDALKSVSLAIQVVSARPAGLDRDAKEHTTEEGLKTGIFVNRFNHGSIEFDILSVVGGRLTPFQRIKSTQTEFVRFLQQGVMFDESGKAIHIAELKNAAYPNVHSLPKPQEGDKKKDAG